LKGGVSLPARRARHKVFLTKIVFEGRGRTQQKKVYKKSKPFFVNLGQEGYSWYPFP